MSEYKAQAPQTESLNWKDTLKSKTKKTVGVTALAGAVMIGGNACAQEQIPKIETSITDIETAQPASLSSEQIEEMGSTSFNNLPEAARIEALGEYLSEDKKIAYNYLVDFLSETEKQIVKLPDLSKNPKDYTPQEVLNNFTLGVWDASIQGDTMDNIETGRKLLSIVINPEHRNFDTTLSLIGNGKGGVIDTYKQLPMNHESKISNTEFMGHNIGTNGGDVIMAESLETGDDYILLFTNLSTSDGQTVSMLTDSFNSTNPKAKEAIAKLPQTKLTSTGN